MNKKKLAYIGLVISTFFLVTSSVLIVIGKFSNTLITRFWQLFCGGILIIASIIFLVCCLLIFKYKNRKVHSKKALVLGAVFLAIYTTGCLSFLIILYGPNHAFRDWLITTAMRTMSHQYYCQWFYNEEIIAEVLNNNTIIEVGEDTNPDLVDKDLRPKPDDSKEPIYANKYEKDVLDHEENALYKIINFEVNGCKAYMAFVYDASRVTVGVSRYFGEAGQYVSTMAKYYQAPLAINGGGFDDPGQNSRGGVPIGITIMHGVVKSDNRVTSSYGIIGFNQEDILVLSRNKTAEQLLDEGIRDAVTMGPFLIVNGKKSTMKGNGGWGYAARTAIGQRKDGIVIFLVVDSNEFRTNGASMKDLADIMERYGAINAANLDGGTSSVMSLDYEIINDPIDSTLKHKTRGIPTIFMVK